MDESASPAEVKLWFWWIETPGGRSKLLPHRMTEEEAQERYPGAMKIEDSLEIRRPL